MFILPPRKKKKKRVVKKTTEKKEEENMHLPGFLMIAFGLLALPLNFGLVAGIEWVKAWPLLLVLFGVAHVVKTTLSEGKF